VRTERFERATGESGLADYEVRTWRGWHHHQTLSLVANWFLTRETQQGKNPRRRSWSRKSARYWLRCRIGNSTAIIPRISAAKQPAACNATKPRDCTTGKNATAWRLYASIHVDNRTQSN
jgi:hypothetical protein